MSSPIMAIKAMDSNTRVMSMCVELNKPESSVDCVQVRGYERASDAAFSVPDHASLELLIQGVLRDDDHPGCVFGLPYLTDPMLTIHVEAGLLRRLCFDCKNMTTKWKLGSHSIMVI